MTDNKVLEVTPDVKWIGVLDPDLITFDVVMQTRYGTTYNSYFVNATKKTIVETVKENYWETYLAKIRQVTDPAEIEYIVLEHAEPDHTGCLGKLLALAPNATVIGSGNAIRYLRDMLGTDFPHRVVKDGDVLDLGNKKLRIISAPNLHWPDSIYTYLIEDKVLFTCDSFGAHYCSEEMFDDKVGNWDEAFRYYFDVIMKPFSKFMLKAIGKIKPLEIATICPGHGPILRTDWKKYVDLSEKYALAAAVLPGKQRVFIPYVSAYHNTGALAFKIAEGISQPGDIEVQVMDIEHVSMEVLEDQIASSTGIIVGCPIINQNILLPVYQLFAAINPIRDHGKLCGAFGSYGWSGEAFKLIENNLSNLKLKFFGNGVYVKFTPHSDELQKGYDYGKAFAAKLLVNGAPS
ncbi:MAG TPA: FprA family A-type flavoprotein [Bacteroidales bacterium]